MTTTAPDRWRVRFRTPPLSELVDRVMSLLHDHHWAPLSKLPRRWEDCPRCGWRAVHALECCCGHCANLRHVRGQFPYWGPVTNTWNKVAPRCDIDHDHPCPAIGPLHDQPIDNHPWRRTENARKRAAA